ncbi:SE1561 family protein [Evansella halocellulosilytica]|uniref:SE1561 family protein n=1 Tax=Evansella halocellulosilytica TaxID=2011013 RepID=UPI000BB87282|nr:SE1561 family protein [Evansella halocellulosilytica]
MNNMQMGKEEKMSLLHQRMEHLVKMLDSIDPEKAGVEDIDRIIEKLDELEKQCQSYRKEIDGE